MMKYKLAIFDFDGTLADSFPWFLSVFNTVADRYRFKRVEQHEGPALRGYNTISPCRYSIIPVRLTAV